MPSDHAKKRAAKKKEMAKGKRKGGANKEIVKQIHRSLLQGIPATNPKVFSADSSAQDFLFDQEVP